MKRNLIICLVFMLVGCTVDIGDNKLKTMVTGTASALNWVASDNPSRDEIYSMQKISRFIRDEARSLTTIVSYSNALKSDIFKFITENYEEDQQYNLKMGSILILGCLDTFLAEYPDLTKDNGIRKVVIFEFYHGVANGLHIKVLNPIMQAARRTAKLRMELKQNNK